MEKVVLSSTEPEISPVAVKMCQSHNQSSRGDRWIAVLGSALSLKRKWQRNRGPLYMVSPNSGRGLPVLSLNTNLHGRLRNTSLPTSSGLLPIFEAVVNSIHAIDEAKSSSPAGRIRIEVIRDDRPTLPLEVDSKRRIPVAKADITGFSITDTGVGFNDENMQSFLTLDSEYKADRGGRGVGRLLWLKAFEYASIDSAFDTPDEGRKRRLFKFNEGQGVFDEQILAAEGLERVTTIQLVGFDKRYREAAPKSGSAIAKHLFEHCLWYFIRAGGAPKIELVDEGERIVLDMICEDHMRRKASSETIFLKGVDFVLTHIKLAPWTTRTHAISFCAGNRLVVKENIKGKVPGLFGPLQDIAGDFVYECYVSSPFLDERVRSERIGFDIPEEPRELFAANELSQKEIRDAVIERAAEHLQPFLEQTRRLGKDRVDQYVAHRAPRYRPILSRIPQEQLCVDPEISDRDLEILLHNQLADIEGQMLAEGHDILRAGENVDSPEYRKRLNAYLKTAEDIKRSDLAGYVSHRRVIIELLELAIQRKSDGGYETEDVIHRLIMPQGKESNEAGEGCNLWLIDERLAFHDYLASDKPLSSMTITDSTSRKEPDIVALNVFDNPILVSEDSRLPLASLTVIELKRPMRNDAAEGVAKDPIEQALAYLEQIRKGGVRTSNGRLIPSSPTVPGFCYVLCDLTPTMVNRCKMHDAILTSDGMGFFFYNKTFGAYVEVSSFDRLVNSAKERNRAFFDKLGLPCK